MKVIAALACLLATPVPPALAESQPERAHLVEAIRADLARDSFGRRLDRPASQSRLARAIDDAWKKDASEENLKAWSEVLVKCQQATNPAWATALLRSEAQQAHCYRY